MANDGKTGVALLQMGGPASTEEIRPFLENLFSDPAILSIPVGFIRRMLARRIAKKRAPKVIPRYEAIGGASPILKETRKQAKALEERLGLPVRVAMRYSFPRAEDAANDLAALGATQVVALPLYPQYCRATSRSSLEDFRRAADGRFSLLEIESYPKLPGFLRPMAEDIRKHLGTLDNPVVLFTAHGLPERAVKKGDPYPEEVASTVKALESLLPAGTRTKLAFQSRLGPVKWMKPYLDETVESLGRAGEKELVVVPIAFVGEHIETLHELDIELRELAEASGVERFERVPTVGVHPEFIDGLAELVQTALKADATGKAEETA